MTAWQKSHFISFIQLQKVCLIDDLHVASMPGHSIKQRAQRKIAVELSPCGHFYKFSLYKFVEMSTWRQELYVHVQVLTPKYLKTVLKYKYQVLHLWICVSRTGKSEEENDLFWNCVSLIHQMSGWFWVDYVGLIILADWMMDLIESHGSSQLIARCYSAVHQFLDLVK